MTKLNLPASSPEYPSMNDGMNALCSALGGAYRDHRYAEDGIDVRMESGGAIAHVLVSSMGVNNGVWSFSVNTNVPALALMA